MLSDLEMQGLYALGNYLIVVAANFSSVPKKLAALMNCGKNLIIFNNSSYWTVHKMGAG